MQLWPKTKHAKPREKTRPETRTRRQPTNEAWQQRNAHERKGHEERTNEKDKPLKNATDHTAARQWPSTGPTSRGGQQAMTQKNAQHRSHEHEGAYEGEQLAREPREKTPRNPAQGATER